MNHLYIDCLLLEQKNEAEAAAKNAILRRDFKPHRESTVKRLLSMLKKGHHLQPFFQSLKHKELTAR